MISLRISKYSKSTSSLALLIALPAWAGPLALSYDSSPQVDFAVERRSVTAWNEHLHAEALPDFRVLDAAIDPDSGEVWLGTMGAGLVRHSGGHFTIWDQMNSGLAGNIVLDVQLAEGRVWAATNGGLSCYDPLGDRWTLYNARTAKLPQLIFINVDTCEGRVRAVAFNGRQFAFDSASQTFVPSESNAECKRETAFAATCITILNDDGRIEKDEVQGRPTIAIYGPRNRTISIPGARSSTSGEAGRPELAAVEQAIDAANKAGGYRSETPFDLAIMQPGYANYAWGLPEDDLVSLEQRAEVLGMVGFIAEGEYITDAVLSRMDLPWMNVAPPETALGKSETVDTLVFQCWGDQPRQHRAVLDYSMQRSGARRAAFIAGDGADSDRHIRWWKDYAHGRKVQAVADYKLTANQTENRENVGYLSVAELDVVFVWADCATSMGVVDVLRESSESVLIIAGPQIMEGCNAEQADLRNVIAFLPSDELGSRTMPTGEGAARENVLLKGVKESENAARTFHATQHLLAAMNASDKSRSAVRRKLAELSRSAFGEEHFESMHEPGPVTIAEFRDNAWHRSTFRPAG